MSTEARVTNLENAMAELARAQALSTANLDRLAANLDRLAEEMRTFKDEMRTFRDEMHVSYEKLHVSHEKLQAASDGADRRMGSLTNQLGRLVEDIVGPSIPASFSQLFHIPEIAVTGIRFKR